MSVLKSQSVKPGTTVLFRLPPPKEMDWLLVIPLSIEVPEPDVALASALLLLLLLPSLLLLLSLLPVLSGQLPFGWMLIPPSWTVWQLVTPALTELSLESLLLTVFELLELELELAPLEGWPPALLIA